MEEGKEKKRGKGNEGKGEVKEKKWKEEGEKNER